MHQADFDEISELLMNLGSSGLLDSGPQLGKATVEQMLEFWYVDEFELSFGGLVEVLAWGTYPLPEEMQKQLLAFAADYDARSKGKISCVEELRKVFA